ncbi:DUF2997 domain-containing protein (plasmid) [Nostoc sp. C052]|jgi:hypothetical protein|uniref:DUF2997 domain-containing protein n=2 Tax=Nostoc TaxID=1177 RepID=A0ABR8IL32_9NOSO|nr:MULTISPECIES: DUF2997 domain-containing protein [Nostoc]MBD2564697.1 DUF2997 domain-containing protein [Nostoc linckia FACHB-391]MBD2651521.1 DUF2997 domain-containing protein [Nostoc foliaceum FACHB-393]QLE45770.1 DUF2997 domain-containing protein [Nostoc sp. C052]
MERSILIHFDSATGEVKVEALGFEGLTCLSATQPFEEALGVVQGEREFKPEAQQQRITSTHQQYQRQ